MMTKEEVASSSKYCNYNGVSYEARLSELGVTEWRLSVYSGIDLNLRLGSLEVRVVCGAFCLGCGSWVRELYY